MVPAKEAGASAAPSGGGSGGQNGEEHRVVASLGVLTVRHHLAVIPNDLRVVVEGFVLSSQPAGRPAVGVAGALKNLTETNNLLFGCRLAAIGAVRKGGGGEEGWVEQLAAAVARRCGVGS